MKTCVLFDFDGTIINTNSITKKGLDVFSLKVRDTALTEAEHQMLLGRPLEDQIRYLDAENTLELTEAFKHWYQEAHATEEAYLRAFQKFWKAFGVMATPWAL